MDRQYKLNLGGGISSPIYDELQFMGEWVKGRMSGDELWTYHPVWVIQKIEEIEKKEPEFVRAPGISLSERRIR